MPPSPPPAGAPPADLAALRAELDGIDDALHDLLMRRAEVVAWVGASADKAATRVALRPGREAAIIRRLLARHSGPLPPRALVRLWRELLAATTAMQRPFIVAVCDPDPGAALIQAAREQFGALTPLRIHRRPSEAIGDVSAGTASVAVLPLPVDDELPPAAWWTALLHAGAPRLHIIARLPFWAPRAEGAPAAPALVVAAIAPDPSGQDRSLIGLELDRDTSRARLAAALTEADLAPSNLIVRHDPGLPVAHALAEVAGALTEADPRLASLRTLRPPVMLGAYAIPVNGAAA
jgi:chorismate mutase / prephenate dehydratase